MTQITATALFVLVSAAAAFHTPSLSTLRRFSSSSLSMSAEAAPKKKIVITGIGSVTSLGLGSDDHFQKLLRGESGIARLPEWADEYPCQVGAIVDDEKLGFEVTDWMDRKDAKRQARYTHFSMAASKMAIKDAGINVEEITDPSRFGVLIGSGIGGVEWFEENCLKYHGKGGGKAGLKKVSPFLIPALISNTASGVVAIELGARGPNFGVVSACATGSHALGTAMDFMQRGEADIMLAGGSEAAITPLCFAGFVSMRAMVTTFNDNPTAASRPFDKNRAGFVMGEGCGVICLETEEHALARGADIYCELAGYGASCDAHHITAPLPDGSGLAQAMQMAMDNGAILPEDIGYVNAHGTSTPYNDKFETMAIKTVLGEHAYKTKISSIKSMIGHTLGAAGSLEAGVVAQVIKSGKIPPTMNLDEPDEEAGCTLDYVPGKMQEAAAPIKAAISQNLGFGGHNVALTFKRYGD